MIDDDETGDQEIDDRYRQKLTVLSIRTNFRDATKRAVALRDPGGVAAAVRTLLADCAWTGVNPMDCL